MAFSQQSNRLNRSSSWNIIDREFFSMGKLLICIATVLICTSCVNEKPLYAPRWHHSLSNLGSSSSPRAADLTNDGIPDIILGAGKLEFESTDTAILALDGLDGRIIWSHPGIDQIFGSPIYNDINGDQTPEVFIGGRSGQMMCLDGSSGRTIWRFDVAKLISQEHPRVLNFYNFQFVPDQDGDGYPDLLAAYGGDVQARPNQKDRPSGQLLVVNAINGNLINKVIIPDGHETYLSPLVSDHQLGMKIIFGSGGETVGGHLYTSFLSDFMTADLSECQILASSDHKGFIAPPAIVDLNSDQIKDIVVNAVDGRTIAIDGATGQQIWSVALKGTEVYGMPAIGFFNEDDVPDVFATYGVGQFPQLTNAVHVAMDGTNGRILFQDTLGLYHYGSAVVYDVNADGLDEVIYHVNIEEMGMIKNGIKIIDVLSGSLTDLSNMYAGANNGSTPLLIDIDQDGFLDIIMAHENDPFNVFSKESKIGVSVRCLETNIPLNKKIKWGAYMGSNYNGIFEY